MGITAVAAFGYKEVEGEGERKLRTKASPVIVIVIVIVSAIRWRISLEKRTETMLQNDKKYK